MERQSSSPQEAPSLVEEVQFSSLRAPSVDWGGAEACMWNMLTWKWAEARWWSDPPSSGTLGWGRPASLPSLPGGMSPPLD